LTSEPLRPRRFFALREDVYVPGRWYLDDPVDTEGKRVRDIWQFTDGKPLDLNERLRIPVDRPGTSLDFTAAGAGSTPIVSPRIASVFRALALGDVQLFPVDVAGTSEPFFLLVVTKLLDCIDDTACRSVKRWGPEDGRPEKTGQYRSVLGLRIHAAKAGTTRVFRLWGWPLPILLDEELRMALERVNIRGARFEEV
jgi:hypothetical protein